MKLTVTIQIGNSDDKLTQSQWKDYVNSVHDLILAWGGEIHFSAPSVGWADWQNCAWVFTIGSRGYRGIKKYLVPLRVSYKQDSVAVTIGTTEFL